MNMERSTLKGVVMGIVVLGMVTGGKSSGVVSFRDCYAKCFLFCMIEPSQTLCTCTTHCLKDCIFPDAPQEYTNNTAARSHGFCKFGCALSLCFNMSSKHHPNGKEVENCVGSCSNMCTKNYVSP